MCLTYSTHYYQGITLENWFTNLEQTALNPCQPLPTPYKHFTQQETLRQCLLFILQPIYLHNLAHVLTANHIPHLPTATLFIDESNCSPGFFYFSTGQDYHLTLKMASAQVVETSVTNNSPCKTSSRLQSPR